MTFQSVHSLCESLESRQDLERLRATTLGRCSWTLGRTRCLCLGLPVGHPCASVYGHAYCRGLAGLGTITSLSGSCVHGHKSGWPGIVFHPWRGRSQHCRGC